MPQSQPYPGPTAAPGCTRRIRRRAGAVRRAARLASLAGRAAWPVRAIAAAIGLAGWMISGCVPPDYAGDPTAPLPQDLPRSQIAPLAPLLDGLDGAPADPPATAEVRGAGDALRRRAEASPAGSADADLAARGAALRARAAAVRGEGT